MTEPSLALQKTIRARLIASPAVTALVPAGNVLDRHERPERFPVAIIGEGQSVYADDFDTFADRAIADVHVFHDEAGLAGAKAIAGTIRDALRSRPWQVEGFTCVNLAVVNARFMRDPGGKHSHAIVSIEAILKAVAA